MYFPMAIQHSVENSRRKCKPGAVERKYPKLNISAFYLYLCTLHVMYYTRLHCTQEC